MSGASENFKLLQRAFVEVMNEKAQAALLEYPENPVYSNKHLHAMKRILFGKDKYLHAVSEIRFKKRFIARFDCGSSFACRRDYGLCKTGCRDCIF